MCRNDGEDRGGIYFCTKMSVDKMKKYIFLFVAGILGTVVLKAQPSLFRPLTWEQASDVAVRENKLVLVEAGPVGKGIGLKLEKSRELSEYLLRQTVAVRMDMSSPAGKRFEERLLLYTPPVFAFFMPYGDLVGVVSGEEVGRNVEVLRETLQQAQRAALIKKNNSRSVVFADLDEKQALAEAAKTGRNLFVYVRESRNQPALLMERNVLNLDLVADFFNRNFINLSLDREQAAEWLRQYSVNCCPAYLFFNSQGKLLYRAEGFCGAEQLVGYGELALKKAEGIPFEVLDAAEAEAAAKRTGKLLFTDFYIPGNQHKELLQTVFADPEVTELFVGHFVNVARVGERAFLQFADASGKEIHRVERVNDAEDLLEQARRALSGRGVAGMAETYRQGNREADFVEEYMEVLERAGRAAEASQVAMDYLQPLTADCLKEKRYWDLFDRYVRKVSPGFGEEVLKRKEELAGIYGGEAVQRKLEALWMAGAGDFVVDGRFDEEGFKKYVRQLKKEKVAGWRPMARNARMLAAEQLGDWKTFISLAEEKWNEEQLPDAELYRWGMKIDAECQDDGVRYKMAQWLAERALQIRRKEQSGGKVKMDSYRGFFEKLADDLLKKK